MKRTLFIFLIIISSSSFAQESPKKLGFFTSFDVNIGLDLADMIRRNRVQSDYEESQLPPGKFNYGITGMVGYQAFKWFSISGGLRYSFIDPNYHLVYYKVQPQFYLNSDSDDDFTFLFLNFGNKLNETAAKKASFVGIGIGKTETLSKRFGHQFQVSLDFQKIDHDTNVFIGISYGIILFSNKNL